MHTQLWTKLLSKRSLRCAYGQKLLAAFFTLSLLAPAAAQRVSQAQLDYHSRASLDEFRELLALANDAHFPAHIAANIAWCEQAFPRRGFRLQRLETTTQPLLLAERRSSRPDAPTVLAYLQMDGQPVDPAHWDQPSPWEATLKKPVEGEGWVTIDWSSLQGSIDPDWRIFARSAADAKGPVMMLLAAFDALDAAGAPLPYHLKIVIDFEEELGSPQLPAAVERNRAQLAADAFVIFDGPPHISNEPTLTFGARGMAEVRLTVYGPTYPQHSGHYGNYCPNPALRLSQLLAGMKDEQGRVLVPGFYEGVTITEQDRREMALVPDDEAYMRAKLGIAAADRVAESYQASLQYPSLNIRGLSAGWTGDEVRTIIPATATAEIDIRLVESSEPDSLLQRLRRHIEQQGYVVLDRAPNSRERLQHDKLCRFDYSVAYRAFRTPLDAPVGRWLSDALEGALGRPPIKVRTLGGSIPISPFVSALQLPAVIVPTVNPDNNQHSPNENLRLGNYFAGVKIIAAILQAPLRL